MSLREALDRKPADLTQRHTQVARALIGNPGGVTREWAERMTGLPDREFRQCIEDINASGWLPILADRTESGPARYRIAGPDEAERVAQEAQEHYARAISLHKRSRGLVQAFQHHHHAGGLFMPDIPDELEPDHA